MSDIEGILARLKLDEEALYRRFNFGEKWRKYPIRDCTRVRWILSDNNLNIYHFSETLTEVTPDDIRLGSQLYSGTVQGFYKSQGYLALVVDTQCDGNIFFDVYKEALQVTDPELVRLCKEHWG